LLLFHSPRDLLSDIINIVPPPNHLGLILSCIYIPEARFFFLSLVVCFASFPAVSSSSAVSNDWKQQKIVDVVAAAFQLLLLSGVDKYFGFEPSCCVRTLLKRGV
jgi:hypothetical protein